MASFIGAGSQAWLSFDPDQSQFPLSLLLQPNLNP